MRQHEFTLILAAPEQSDANALYEAGCGDGSISTLQGMTRIEFHRQAGTLDEAIWSAISSVQAGGFQVARVEIESQSLGPI